MGGRGRRVTEVVFEKGEEETKAPSKLVRWSLTQKKAPVGGKERQ